MQRDVWSILMLYFYHDNLIKKIRDRIKKLWKKSKWVGQRIIEKWLIKQTPFFWIFLDHNHFNFYLLIQKPFCALVFVYCFGDFDFRKSIDLGGHIFLAQYFAKTREKKITISCATFVQWIWNLHTTYSINAKHHTGTHMSPCGLDFYFRTLIDLSGHIFLIHFGRKIVKNNNFHKSRYICPMHLKIYIQHIL